MPEVHNLLIANYLTHCFTDSYNFRPKKKKSEKKYLKTLAKGFGCFYLGIILNNKTMKGNTSYYYEMLFKPYDAKLERLMFQKWKNENRSKLADLILQQMNEGKFKSLPEFLNKQYLSFLKYIVISETLKRKRGTVAKIENSNQIDKLREQKEFVNRIIEEQKMQDYSQKIYTDLHTTFFNLNPN